MLLSRQLLLPSVCTTASASRRELSEARRGFIILYTGC